MASEENIQEEVRRDRVVDRVILGAPLGVAIVTIVQFLQVDQMDIPLTVSLYFFTAAIPLLSMGVFLATAQTVYEDHTVSNLGSALEWLGQFAAFIGIAGIFWHFSWHAAVLFVGFSLFAVGFSLYQLRRIAVRN